MDTKKRKTKQMEDSDEQETEDEKGLRREDIYPRHREEQKHVPCCLL
jgi:hypothetical protein